MLFIKYYKYRLKSISHNTSTCSGISVVTLMVDAYGNNISSTTSDNENINEPTRPVHYIRLYTKPFDFKYIWKMRRPDISQFKQYKDKEVTLTDLKERDNTLYVCFDPRDYILGNPKADLYGKRGKYLGSSREFAAFIMENFNPTQPITLYINE